MEKYAKVIVRSNTFHTDNLFTYKIPEFLKNQIYVGHRVLVPFGKGNKPTEAFVFKISDTLEEDMKLKEVVDVLDEEPIFKLEDLELVNWMKNRYLCTYIDCINLIYPKGYKVNNYKVVSLSDEVLNLNENEFTDLLSSLDDIQKYIISKINISKGKLKTEKLKKIPNINYILDKMSKKNIINLKNRSKDLLALVLTILVILFIAFILWHIPFTKNYLINLYNNNSAFHFIINFFSKIFK